MASGGMQRLRSLFPKAKPVILVVEDEPATQFILEHYLDEHGFTVVAAGCSAEAMTVLAHMPSIAALFTDVNLPGMNGYALAQLARETYPKLPIILGSGSGLATALPLGDGYCFFMKPYDFPKIAQHIHRVVGTAV